MAATTEHVKHLIASDSQARLHLLDQSCRFYAQLIVTIENVCQLQLNGRKEKMWEEVGSCVKGKGKGVRIVGGYINLEGATGWPYI